MNDENKIDNQSNFINEDNILKFVIVTGMSGSGKSTALRILEDIGFFCVDNLPVPFLIDFAKLCLNRKDFKKVAIGLDVRGHIFENSFQETIDLLNKQNYPLTILFLDSSDNVIIRRYSETRRPHPLSLDGSVIDGINKERQLIAHIRESAQILIDTSVLTVHDLRRIITEKFSLDEKTKLLSVIIESFGFRYGPPMDADLVFDVRFLPNPYFKRNLRFKNGKDKKVIKYLLNYEDTKIFLKKIVELLFFLLPLYEKEGKSYLTIGIGCTGGQHRSVAIAEMIAQELSSNWNIKIRHRDSSKWFTGMNDKRNK